MHAPRWVHKFVGSLLVISLLLPGVYVALTPQAPAEAQMFTFGTTVVDIPFIVTKIQEIVKIALDIAIYKTLAFTVRQLASDAAQGTARLISGGKVGNEPLFFEQPPGAFVEQMGEQAGGFFIEGFAEGIAVEEEIAKNPGMDKERALKEKKGSIIPRAQELVNQMCNPDPRFRFMLIAMMISNISIKLGLPPLPFGLFAIQTKKTAKPACTFTQAFSNWKSVIVDTTMKEWGDITKLGETITNLPGKLQESLKEDANKIGNELVNLSTTVTALSNDPNFQAKMNRLQQILIQKTAGIQNIDPKNASGELPKLQQSAANIPRDPEVLSLLAELEVTVNNTNNPTAKSTFQGVKQRVMAIGSNPQIQMLFTDANQAATDQQGLQLKVQLGREQGTPTGWQVLQDMIDPTKQDQAIQSKTVNLLQEFIDQMQKAATLERTDPGVPRPKTELSGAITSPPFTVQSFVSSSLGSQSNDEKMTGNLQTDVANLIGEFADSLFAKSGEMLMAGFTAWQTDQMMQKVGGRTEQIGKAIDRAVAGLPSPEEKAAINQSIVNSLSSESQTSIGISCEGNAEACPPGLICNAASRCEAQAYGSACRPATPGPQCPGSLVCTDNICVNPAPSETQGIAEYPPSSEEGLGQTASEVVLEPSSEAITNPSFSAEAAKRTSIQARISKLVALPKQKEESFNILANLQADCAPGNPDSCTIKRPFGQAIQEKLTIAEAVLKFRTSGGTTGLDERLIFGFKRGYAGQAIEPDISQGIPYSSMIVLRKYRVIPVAWELAALYIRDHANTCGAKDCTLGDVLRQYNEPSATPPPLYRMIDPNWVLKAPGAKCMLKGYGPPVAQLKGGQGDSADENAQWVCKDNDSMETPAGSAPGTAPKCNYEYKIQPRAEICLDQQTCIDETSSGKCKAYGYCLEEKKRWQFAGTECKKRYASCLTFTNTATKVSASFLRDTVFTLNFGHPASGGACDATNANCAQYSKSLTLKPGMSGNQRSDYDWVAGQEAYFTPTAKDRGACTPEVEGCRALVQTELNLFTDNIGAEIGTTSYWGVRDFGIDDSSGNAYVASDRPFQGTKYFAANNDGGLNRRVTLTPGATYTLAARMRVHATHINTGDESAGYLVVGKGVTSRDVVDELCNINQYDQGDTLGAWSLCTKTFTAPQADLYVGFRSAGNTHSINVDTVVLLAGSLPSDYYSTTLKSSTTGNETLAALYGDEVRGATHIKVAPDAYLCSSDLGYKKEICRGFALHCPARYANCAKYTPANGDPAIAGVNPDSTCNASCVGMTSFKQQPTQLETPTVWDDFIATAATQCSAESVGCDEYTNVETGAVAEQKDTYSNIARCVKMLDKPEDQRGAHQDVFYSWIGSDEAGAQLEKFLLSSSSDTKDETTSRNPVCWKNPQGKTDCNCDSALNGPGRPLCRQFFRLKPDGSQNTAQSWWRIQEDLVFVTPKEDCTQYRRTIDQQQYLISKSMSKKCAAQFAGCREYHASQAGALSSLLPDHFDSPTSAWISAPGNSVELLSTQEGETLNDNSLRAKNATTSASSISIQKPVALKKGSVIISFAIKGVSGATLTTKLFASGSETDEVKALVGEGSAWAAQTLDGTWQYFRYSAVNLSLPQGSSPILRITTSKPGGVAAQFYLDDVVVRQSEGIAYVVKDSWNGKIATACYRTSADGKTIWNSGNADQMNCHEYTDKDGKRLVFQRFGALCPSEMVGCKQFVYVDSARPSTTLVDDPKKYCKPADNKCTAYGLPRRDALGALQSYQNVYYKIMPEETTASTDEAKTRGICKSQDLECTDFATKYGHEYFKNPGKKILRWRAAKDAAERLSYPDGVWYRTGCATSGADCLADNQCPDGQKCVEKNLYTSPTATGTAGYAALCPSDQSTCSNIIDPECRAASTALSDYLTLRTNYGRASGDTGTTCQREYYYLDDVYASTKQCTSQVNVEAGCLLFDAKYPAEGQGKTVTNKYNTSTIYATADLRLGRSISAAEAPSTDTGRDANTLLKVKLDRACKTWLGCIQESVDSFGTRTCTKRSPCAELDDNGECANFLDVDTDVGKADAPQLKQTFTVSNTAAVPDMTFASLSGLSRPTLTINSISVGSKVIPSPTDKNGVKIIPHDGLFNWSGNEGKINTTTAGNFGLSNDILAICRAHPQKDTPIAQKGRGASGILDQCKYSRSGSDYQGLTGFCMETYAKPGYGNYCLNWYPTDKPEGALAAFDNSPSGEGGKAFAPTNKPLQYCIKKEEYTLFGSDSTSWANSRILTSFCSGGDGTQCTKNADCPNGQNCNKDKLVQSATNIDPNPKTKTLTFDMVVKYDGQNDCPAWDIFKSNITRQCSKSGSDCTNDANACASTCQVSSKVCDVPGGWRAIDTNSCNGSCEVYKASVCRADKRVCDNPGGYTQNCTQDSDCTYTVPQTCRQQRGVTCAPSGLWNTCAKDYHDWDWECRYDGWSCGTYDKNDQNQKWTDCNGNAGDHDGDVSKCPTIYKNVDCPYQAQGTCWYSSSSKCVVGGGETEYHNDQYDYCSTYAGVYNTNNGTGRCSVKKSSTCSPSAYKCNNTLSTTTCSGTSDSSTCAQSCVANINNRKMSCNVHKTGQTESNAVATLTTGDLNASSVAIKNADGSAATVSIPLTYNNIASFAYEVKEGATVKSGATDDWNGGSRTIWFSTYSGQISDDSSKRNGDVKNFYPSQKNCPQDGNEWYMIYPWFGNTDSTLKGFKYALCAPTISGDRTFNVTVTITLKTQNYKSIRQTRQSKLTDWYCKEFATVVTGSGSDIYAIPTTRTSDLTDSKFADIFAATDLTKPYSFGGGTDSHRTREFRIVTPDSPPDDDALVLIETKDVTPTPSTYPAAPHTNPNSSNPIGKNPTTFSVIKSAFVKIYNFLKLIGSVGSYTYSIVTTSSWQSPNKTAEEYWSDATSAGEPPQMVSRRCTTSSPTGETIMCSYTRDCPANVNDCSVKQDNSFAIIFPRESVNQQRATMQFYVWTNSSQSPLRELWIRWGDGRYQEIANTVANSGDAQDNSPGFPGKVYPPERVPAISTNDIKGNSDDSVKEFSFIYNYPRTFWPTHQSGTDICLFAQNNWYFWKQVCGRFKIGEGGFVELDKTYSQRGFSQGWRTQTGKGMSSGTQPQPNAGVCKTEAAANPPVIKNCWVWGTDPICTGAGNLCLTNN